MEFTILDKRIWIKGLTLECPLGLADDECPLNALRHLPTAQINDTINALTDEQIDAIVRIHKHCHQSHMVAA